MYHMFSSFSLRQNVSATLKKLIILPQHLAPALLEAQKFCPTLNHNHANLLAKALLKVAF